MWAPDDARQQQQLRRLQMDCSVARSMMQERTRGTGRRSADVVLHVDGCAFALRSLELLHACPALFVKLSDLRRQSDTMRRKASTDASTTALTSAKSARQRFQLRLKALPEAAASRGVNSGACPLAIPTEDEAVVVGRGPLSFAHCLNHTADQLPVIVQSTALSTMTEDGRVMSASPPAAEAAALRRHEQKRRRSIEFSEDLSPILGPVEANQPQVQQYQDPKQPQPQEALDAIDVLHVELSSIERNAKPTAEAVATVLEFLFTDQIRFVREESAERVLQLCTWLEMTDSTLHIACLDRLVTHITLDNWMDIVFACEHLRNQRISEGFMDQAIYFLTRLPRDQNDEILKRVPLERIAWLDDQALVTRIVRGVVNLIHHVGIRRKVLMGLERWLARAFDRPFGAGDRSLSLVDLHNRYASWDPFFKLPQTDVAPYVPMTLFEAEDMEFQVLYEPDSLQRVRWRVVKMDPSDPTKVAPYERKETTLVLRGRLHFAFEHSYIGMRTLHAPYEQELVIRYTHSLRLYGKWFPSRSESSPAEYAPPRPPPDARLSAVHVSGELFCWGHLLCEFYHYMLLTTLFYTAGHSSRNFAKEKAVDAVVHKIQRLPFDTLVMMLRSDRLRMPDDETGLLKVITQLLFGCTKPSTTADSETEFQPHKYTHEEIVTIFHCIRWHFADLELIRIALESAPEELRLELIDLVDTALQSMWHIRRTPWAMTENPYKPVTHKVEFRFMVNEQWDVDLSQEDILLRLTQQRSQIKQEP